MAGRAEDPFAAGHLWTGTVKTTSSPTPIPVVGLLMHALEYPAYDEDAFPYNLGRFIRVNSLVHWSIHLVQSFGPITNHPTVRLLSRVRGERTKRAKRASEASERP